MGRLTLMLVMAAAISGAMFTLSTRGAMSDTDRAHAEGQADVLAREIAEAGQAVALSQMLDGDGFRDPTRKLGDYQPYDGGEFAIEYVEGATDREAQVRVMGTYGGAAHAIESDYRYDPMDAPGPLWLDVPHVVTTVSGRPKISGEAGDHEIQFDRRKHDALDLEGLVPLASVQGQLNNLASAGRSAVATPAANAWTGDNGLLEDLNVTDAEDLYQLAVASMDASDRSFAGAHVVSGSTTWGDKKSGDQVTHVNGDLTVSGNLEGHGALLVNGALRVSGKFEWDGIVVVRSTADVLPIELTGNIKIKGMMAVAHQAFAPGGHLDVTINRDATGMSPAAPQGNTAGSPWGGRYPFFQHTHAFDITPTATPRGDQVRFLTNGANSVHESETQFRAFLASLDPNLQIQLAFGNPGEHGFSTFGLEIANKSDAKPGTVQNGFGAFAQANAPHTTQPFRAGDLRNLDVDVRSLRALQEAFDNDGQCTSYPLCVGREWNRRGALSLRVLRASDATRLYEASFYWHMRQDEEAAHAAEEAAWRDRIAAGEAFGTQLHMGGDVELKFDIKEIKELTDKLGFDGDEIDLVASRSTHATAAEARADGNFVCHGDGGSGGGGADPVTIHPPTTAVDMHLNHGDTPGPCPPAGTSGGSGKLPTGSGSTTMCHNGTSTSVPNLSVLLHLLHGDRMGACVSGDDDD